MTEWQPIETAPRDGSWFLGYRPSNFPEARVEVWAWNGHGADDDLFIDAYDSVCDDCQPTHWMPLPAPPETNP